MGQISVDMKPTMLCILFLLSHFVVPSEAGRKAPSVCSNGHENRWLPELGRLSISTRGLCWLCVDVLERMRDGGRAGGPARKRYWLKKLRRAPLTSSSASKHAARSARRLLGLDGSNETECLDDVFVFEIYAGRCSKVSLQCALRGARVIRVCKPPDSASGLNAASPDLARPGLQTWCIDLVLPEAQEQAIACLRDVCLRRSVRRVVLLTAPPCTAWCQWHNVNRKRKRNPCRIGALIAKRRVALVHLSYCRRLHALVQRWCAAGRCVCVHEQPVTSKAPLLGYGPATFVHTEWPYAIGGGVSTADVCGCAVGLRAWRRGGMLMSKAWRFEILGCDALVAALASCVCTRNHQHSPAAGSAAAHTESYPTLLAAIIAHGTLHL